MRIALINHGTASEWGGGDGVQIRETARVLRTRGHQVSIQNSDKPNLEGAQLAHIFNCRVADSFKQQIAVCQIKGVPIVVSPIWISIGRALWGSRGTFGILKKGLKYGGESIQKDLQELESRRLNIKLEQGVINSDGKGQAGLEWQEEVSNILKTCDGVLTNSWLELKAVQTDLKWYGDNYNVARYGVNPQKFLDADPQEFREHTGIKGKFIMQAGRIEPGKNQAMLCWALRNEQIPIVLIGSSKHWPEYVEVCKAISGNKLTVIDHMPQRLLASAYAAANVHCLPSWMDTCGLVSLEAALSGTALVGSTFGHELEYLQNDAWLADPGSENSIKWAVLNAWEENKNSIKNQRLKQRILAEYNWEKTTNETEKIYQRVIETA